MQIPFSRLLLAIGAGALLLFSNCKKDPPPNPGEFALQVAKVGSATLSLNTPLLNDEVPFDATVELQFNQAIDPATIEAGITWAPATPFSYALSADGLSCTLFPQTALLTKTTYTLAVSGSLKSKSGAACTPQTVQFTTKAGALNLVSATVNGANLLATPAPRDVALNFSARLRFDRPLLRSSVNAAAVKVYRQGEFADLQMDFDNGDSTLVLTSTAPLRHYERYSISISNTLMGVGDYQFSPQLRVFYTALDPTPKFPLLSDDALLTLVQAQTFKYFWDFGHPVSGLARERNTSGDVVTTGGSGFGLMSIIVGIERGFITRSEGVERWKKTVDFLTNNAQRYHGVFAHWLNGATGATIPFSTKDDGADLVETSFLMQGLLTVRQYLNPNDPEEQALRADIQALWEGVEWDWFTRGGQNVLYWHWSPNYNWDMNLQLRGYNETLITYFLAACSPTHPISAEAYHKGWASSGNIKNGNSYYGYNLPMGEAKGGPLFFAHYSYLGLDPRNLKDDYANFWEQNQHHALINRAHCIENPFGKVGYGPNCWGLTASDNPTGYSAHSPNNDRGVITPTAALASFPYTPSESMDALKFFYYQLGDKLWGPYGFYDAFSATDGWFATSTLAIDQGPIVVMIENHRTGLLWNLFMSSPEVPVGAGILGITF